MKLKHSIIILLSLILFSCNKKVVKISEISQLKNSRLCILTGSAGDLASKKVFPDAKYLDVLSAPDAVIYVKTNKADAFVHNTTILKKIIQLETELVILEPPVSEVFIAGAIKKNNSELLNKINSVLTKLFDNGTIDKLKQKWIEPGYTKVPDLPKFVGTSQNGILKVGTCSVSEPLSFLSHNRVTGFDIELALIIGNVLGKKVEIIDMEFQSLIPALESGKIDIALSNFNMTEQRKKFIDFSIPYLTNNISVLVRK